MTITIRVTPKGVEVDNRRFLLAEQALIGLTPEAALKRVDVLLALCGRAHQAALELALVAAQKGDQTSAMQNVVPTVIHSTLQEHARYLAMSARVVPIALARQLLQAVLQTPAQTPAQDAPQMWKELVFGKSWPDCYAAWQQGGIAGLHDWANTPQVSRPMAWDIDAWLRSARELSHDTVRVDACADAMSIPLPTTAEQWQQWQALTQVPNDQRYRPVYLGQCADASIAALYGATGNSVSRELARLAQIVRMVGNADLGMSACHIGPQDGMAAVEMARGVLVHRVRLDAMGNIAAVTIVAPTEWVFHPQGIVQQTLEAMRLHGMLNTERINAVVQMFDPCVAWQIES